VIPVESAGGRKYELEVRAFDDGAAVRTLVALDDAAYTIEVEATSWALPPNARAWWSRYNGDYERPFESGMIETIPANTPLAPRASRSISSPPALPRSLDGTKTLLRIQPNCACSATFMARSSPPAAVARGRMS
jgi:hypothetical protein